MLEEKNIRLDNYTCPVIEYLGCKAEELGPCGARQIIELVYSFTVGI